MGFRINATGAFLLVMCGIGLLFPPMAASSFIEQLAISTRAISMANAVTARPPGHMAIHYNPAGLSKLPTGSWWHQGVTIPHLQKTSRFRGNSNFDGWLEQEQFDHFSDPIYQGQPGRDEISADELEAEGEAESGRMFIPILNRPINFQFSPRTSLSRKKEGSAWTLATGIYTPFATGANHSAKGDPTRFGGKSAYMQHLIYQAPAAAYQVNDKLSVGLSVGAGQTAMGAKMDARSPNDLTALTRLLGEATEGMAIPPFSYLYYDEPLYGGGIHPWEKVAGIELAMRNDFTPNYNLGVLYEPWEWLGLGLVYQSGFKADMHGDFKIEYSEDFQRMVHWYGQGPWGVRRTSAILNMPTNPTPKQSGTVTTELEFPQRIQAGVRVSPISRLHLMFDLKWAEWSVRDKDVYRFDQDIQMLQISKLAGHTAGPRALESHRHMKDTLDWAAAIEINLLDWLDVQMGYEYRETSVRKEYFDFATPIPDLHNFGAGFTIHLDNGGRIDVGGAYVMGEDVEIGPEEGKNLTSTDYFNDETNMFAGQSFKQELDIFLLSAGFMVPFDSYVDYQKKNVGKIKSLGTFLNPFARSDDKH